ncbi:lichenicidin alpha family lanthipeptide [Corynebacterium phocae]|uniref:lichenicidin alpha family lanthipeptide n=1 Tax=Corynebacterium phocae TaxID=161895 RepID=UPI000A025286|nr:plantaricin C family lantibiotic [Corynebacterium phocae]
MQAQTKERDQLFAQLEDELRMLYIGEPTEMGLSNFLGNEGKYCTLTKECMINCN